MNHSRPSTAALIARSGLFVACGLILPSVFHFFGGTGPVFLPMHIPVLLAGFILGPAVGALVGFVTPLLSSLLTGMPPLFPMLPIMLGELTAYGFVAGYCQRRLRWPVLGSLVTAMLAGRAVYGLIFTVMLYGLKLTVPKAVSVTTAVLTGLPGIAIQLVLITAAMTVLKRRGIDL